MHCFNYSKSCTIGHGHNTVPNQWGFHAWLWYHLLGFVPTIILIYHLHFSEFEWINYEFLNIVFKSAIYLFSCKHLFNCFKYVQTWFKYVAFSSLNILVYHLSILDYYSKSYWFYKFIPIFCPLLFFEFYSNLKYSNLCKLCIIG